MNQKLKLIIKKIVPKPVISKSMTTLSRLEVIRTKNIFEHAQETPIWLERDILETLQQKYPFPPKYGYDPQSLEGRGKERAGEILSLIDSKPEKINTSLELGCWDGMVSCALQRMGKIATAIDNRSDGFDERAKREGVRFQQMDAAHLQFEDESFDLVFSYDSFEQFADPEAVLQEAIRVVKTRGYIYLKFDPLYMSPRGLHMYRKITVPYFQFLFPRESLQEFVKVKRLGALNFTQDDLNRYSLNDYRKLWNKYSHRLKRIRYNEISNVSYLSLIRKYPSCFKSKTKYFDNLIVSRIDLLFKKIK